MKNKLFFAFLISLMSSGNHSYCQLWKQYADSAKAYNDQKNTDKAIEFYNKAKDELQKDSAGTKSYAQICDSLGLSFYRKKQYKPAEEPYLEAKQIREKVPGKETPDYINSCNNLVRLYSAMGQYEKAETLLLEVKQIREKLFGKETADYARSCNSLGYNYFLMGQYKKAEPLLLEGKQIREKVLGKENPDYALSCDNLAHIYVITGQYLKAEPLLIDVKKIREKVPGKEHPDYATCCMNLAILYSEMGQYEKAEQLYLEAKQILQKVSGKGNPNYAKSFMNLGHFYAMIGQYEKAEPLLLEAKQIQEQMFGKEAPDYIISCNNLGILYKDMGQYEKADLLLRESKQILEKQSGKETADYAITCHNLGELYIEMKQYEKAEQLIIEAKQILEKVLGKENANYAGACNNLASLYDFMGEYEKAEPLYIEAKQIQEKVAGKEGRDYAGSCNNLGDIYRKMGQYKKAEQLLLEAKQIFGKALGKQHQDYVELCDGLAILYWNMQQPLLAEKEIKESFAVNAQNVHSIFQFNNEKEKAAFITNRLGEADEAYSFYVSAKLKDSQPYTLSLFHRNLILSSSEALKKQLFSSNDASLINEYNEWLGLKKYLAVLYSKPISERKEDAAKIEDSAGKLEKELTRLSSGFKKQQQRVGWKEIQDKLKPDEASIEFASFHFYNGKRWTDSIYYIASVLRKAWSEPVMVKLFEKKQLDTLLNSNENPFTDNNNINTLYTANNRLYKLAWKPLEKYLKGITKIYFAPAGNLFKISFAALPVNNKQVLSDKYQLIQLNTTATVTDNDESFITADDKIQLYGGIQYDADPETLKQAASVYKGTNASSRSLPDGLARGAGFQYLPGTQQEAEDIKKQAGIRNASVTILSGTNATEESVKALNGEASPSVLHIATHGFFFPDPKGDSIGIIQQKFETSGKAFKQSDNPLFRSGLLFAGANNAWKGKPIEGIEDGILTAFEVSNMYLPNTKLVVLSACETALGDIQGSEGVYGLQRAFKMAGAQNLVMSLWKVPDAETAEFMQLFYKNLFAKQTISNAFHNAQNVMKNKYRAEPYKWAAWVLVR